MMYFQRVLVFCFIALIISACSDAPQLPPAKPLSVERADLVSALPYFNRGEYSVRVFDNLDIALGENEEGLRALLPVDAPLPLPVLIFSHGAFSDKHKYDAVLEHWASHGFAVLAATHLDGKSMPRGIFNTLRYGNKGLVEERVNDVQAMLAQLSEIDALLPAHTLDVTRIAITGHSFGGFTAQQFAGATAFYEDGNVSVERSTQIKAFVAISPPGPMFESINEQSWKQMQGPVLMTTGTWDVNAQFWPEWQLHRMSFDTAPAGNQYALVIEGADHYLGNLICRPEKDVPPQQDALDQLNAVTTTFLKAWVLDDREAKAWMETTNLGAVTEGFASLSRR